MCKSNRHAYWNHKEASGFAVRVLPAQAFQLAEVQEVAHVVEGPVAHVLNHLLGVHIGLQHLDDLPHLTSYMLHTTPRWAANKSHQCQGTMEITECSSEVPML